MSSYEKDERRFESVYSKKLRAGKRRTYFFDVKRTKGEDFYLALTESSKRMDGTYERHKVFLYKEDFNRFVAALEETLDYVKNELMPHYDYDEFARRQEEYEAKWEEEKAAAGEGFERKEKAVFSFEGKNDKKEVFSTVKEAEEEKDEEADFEQKAEEPVIKKTFSDDDDDMSW